MEQGCRSGMRGEEMEILIFSQHSQGKYFLPPILSRTAGVILCQLPTFWIPFQTIPSSPGQTEPVIPHPSPSNLPKTAPTLPVLTSLFFWDCSSLPSPAQKPWRAPLEGPQVVRRSLSYICHPLELKYNELYK